MGQGSMYLWAVAGVYLVYLGIQQIVSLIRGEASIPWLNAGAGILFIVVGAAVLLREWRAYRKATAKTEEQPEEDAEEGVEEE